MTTPYQRHRRMMAAERGMERVLVKLTLKEACTLMIKMLARIGYIHAKASKEQWLLRCYGALGNAWDRQVQSSRDWEELIREVNFGSANVIDFKEAKDERMQKK